MKKIKIFFIILCCIVIYFIIQNFANSNNNQSIQNIEIQEEVKEEKWFDKYHLVSHAMGGIDEDKYTNSLQSFIINYEKGFKVFEVDFSLTSDNKMVGIHGWNGEPQSYEDFMNKKIYDKYTPLSLDEVIDLMNEYKDIYIILDLKNLSSKEVIQMQINMVIAEVVKRDVDILHRIIVQLYNQDMLQVVNEIYQFDNYIYTLYKSLDTDAEVVKFVKENNIKVVVCKEDKLSMQFIDDLKSLDVAIFVHTINDIDKYWELRRKRVQGVFTDFINPITVKEIKK